MLIQALAELPLRSYPLDRAVREVADFADRHLVPGPESVLALSLATTGARGTSLLAGHVDPAARGFRVTLLPLGEPLTAAEFLEAVAKTKPKQTSSEIRVPATSHDAAVRLLRALADALPRSGRGIILAFQLRGWHMAGTDPAILVDVACARFRSKPA